MSTIAPGSEEWHRGQIEAYRSQFNDYRELAGVVREIVDRVRHLTAPLAVTQARAKSLSSFAEKALRQFRAEDIRTHDPIHNLTDLCGARVITTTEEEVEAVCQLLSFIFKIEEFQNVARRLAVSEFGYQSRHLIAQAAQDSILGVPVPAPLRRLRFEIQVRTILQHAWSDISHDRLYKSAFDVPASFQRDAARIAALLEQAEEAFGKLVRDVESYKVNLGEFMSMEAIRKEVATLETILANEPEEINKPYVAVVLARLSSAAGDWKRIVRDLEPLETAEGPKRPELLVRLGHARCRTAAARTTSKVFKQGQANLEEVARPLAPANSRPDPLRAKALAHLAWSYTRIKGQLPQAHDLFRKSYECDPSNSYHLAAYLESKLRCEGAGNVLEAVRPAIIAAIDTCRRHAKVRIELPWAHLTMGRLLLFLGQPYESLKAYAKAIQCAHNAGELEEALDTTLELQDTTGARFPQLEWVRRLLLVGIIAKEWEAARQAAVAKMQANAELAESDKQQTDLFQLAQQKLRQAEMAATAARERVQAKINEYLIKSGLASDARKSLSGTVIIVAGGSRLDYQERAVSYREALTEAFRGFGRTIISGGTMAGIPGEVGEASRALESQGEPKLHLISYLPKTLAPSVAEDPAYQVFRAGENDFDAIQPLQNWIDILAAGIDPATVRLLGINGREIAAVEYRLALAMGAKVGIVLQSGDAVDELLPDADWADAGNLFALPRDTMTLRAFVHSGGLDAKLGPRQIEALGRKIHETYRRDNINRYIESGMQDWEHLREDFKLSNCAQAAYAEHILRACGFDVQPLRPPSSNPISFTDLEVEKMAEMEHGRWVVERLQSGWRYGEIKNVEKRITPYLIPWDKLSDEIKSYDRRAVRNFVGVLSEAGLGVFRSPARSNPATP